MWTNENRARYDRNRLRYPSDLTDQEWERLSPLIPAARRGGNRRRVEEREIVNGNYGDGVDGAPTASSVPGWVLSKLHLKGSRP